MASFPTLRSGALSQYPSTREVRNDVRVLRFLDGTEQRYPSIGSGKKRWVLQFASVSEDELQALHQFFSEQQGRFGRFSFTDPWDGTEYTDCSFDQDEFHAAVHTDNRTSVVLAITTNRSR